MKTRGTSLIEFLFILVLIVVSVLPLLVAFSRIQEQHNQQLPVAVATGLASQVIEKFVEGNAFADIISQNATPFANPFDLYSFQVVVNFVQPSDLNTPVDPITTNYKRVTITVTHSQIPSLHVRLVTIVTSAGG